MTVLRGWPPLTPHVRHSKRDRLRGKRSERELFGNQLSVHVATPAARFRTKGFRFAFGKTRPSGITVLGGGGYISSRQISVNAINYLTSNIFADRAALRSKVIVFSQPA